MPLRLAGIFFGALLLIAPTAQAQSFGSLDRDGDGLLTFQEAKRRFPRLQDVIFLKADSNGDGVIDRREFPAFQGIYRQVYVAR